MKASFENSVNVLVKAFFDDTLDAMSGCACAVGNLIADANGFTFKKRNMGGNENLLWDQFCDHPLATGVWMAPVRNEEDEYRIALGIQQIETIGYTVDQVRRIEKAFMFVDGPDKTFNGLMAVVDVLADIHEVDLTTKESAKAMFVKA